MRAALEQGHKGLGQTSPNPPVGAIVVAPDGSSILGRGYHHRAGQPHAEVEAIADAHRQHGADCTQGAAIFVTLEPCSTHGRTPPCCDAIQAAGIAQVYVGATDPFPGHQGGAQQLLEAAGISYTSGICEPEAQHLIRFFTHHIHTGLPRVIAKTAVTLDGRATLGEGRSQWISSPESREDVQRIRRECDAILIGGETLRADDPRLTLRGQWAEGRSQQPLRVVVSRSGDLPEHSQLFTDEHADRTLRYVGQSLTDVLTDLATHHDVRSILIESGGRLLAHALDQGHVDEMIYYIAPLMGGGATVPMPETAAISELEGLEVVQIGGDTRISGVVKKIGNI